MNARDVITDESALALDADSADILRPLLQTTPQRPQAISNSINGVLVGELLAIGADGTAPLVRFSGQADSAAQVARSTIDLHGQHVGAQVVLMFEAGDPRKPIIMGVIRTAASELAPVAGHVEVEADGERFLVTAKEQLVLRCGKASITLTKAGKVLIQGAYISSRSTGVNRVKGGSVLLN